ncbi:MAG: hypothetical protein C0524_02340 [Rhodobacter sp.]|nr:hypothetical protein [Rhodobacter sp.]
MLRILIGTGLLLMVVGFGAAGWQYWQSRPERAPEVIAEVASQEVGPQQTWLISPTGGLVPRDDVQAFLAQDRFVPSRTVAITRTAPLTDLLADGETLPETPYLQVLADIRAPKTADGLCSVLLSRVAADCAVNAARVVDGSVDPVMGTAQFRIELVYRLKPADAEMPDLAANVLQGDRIRAELEAGSEASATIEAALAATVEAGLAACAERDAGQTCRILGLALDWSPDAPATGRADIAWLAPLPDGMFAAPPLEPAPEG